ncbi:MAG: hypothetical protein JO071_09720 [Deltaproteobacteria bacterium]|nr:hypothetical protein [Deltaproteobacteria bacterium]
MGDDKRLHRQDPERTGPIRSFGEMYTSRLGTKLRAETATNSAAREEAAGAPAEGVGLAYRIIDKHINDGRRSAGMLNGQPYNTRAAADRIQEVIERTLGSWRELLPLWLEAVATAVTIEPLRMPPTPPPAMPNGENRDASAGGGASAIAIEMMSIRPVTVSIDLRENSDQMPLAALGLRAVDRSKPELSDIGIEPDVAGGIKVRICVPQSHPAGTYSGVIVNRETGESRGTLTVRVVEP